MNLKNVFWGYDCIIQSFPTHNYAFICVIMSFISAGGDLTPNGIELVGDDLTCVDFVRRRLRGRRFDPDSSHVSQRETVSNIIIFDMQEDLRDVIERKFRNSTFSIFSQPRPSACRITSRRLTATRGGGVANDWRWLWCGCEESGR